MFDSGDSPGREQLDTAHNFQALQSGDPAKGKPFPVL